MIWKDKSGNTATEIEIVDIRTEVSFLEKTWIEEMEIKIKQKFCAKTIRFADNSKKIIRYQTEERLINKMNREINMNTGITELENKDIIIGQDGLTSIKSMINWKMKELELNQELMKEISEGLKDLMRIFEKFPDKELSSKRPEMDHEIYLTQETIPLASLISEKPQDHAIIKEYLDKMPRKEGIKASSS